MIRFDIHDPDIRLIYSKELDALYVGNNLLKRPSSWFDTYVWKSSGRNAMSQRGFADINADKMHMLADASNA